MGTLAKTDVIEKQNINNHDSSLTRILWMLLTVSKNHFTEY